MTWRVLPRMWCTRILSLTWTVPGNPPKVLNIQVFHEKPQEVRQDTLYPRRPLLPPSAQNLCISAFTHHLCIQNLSHVDFPTPTVIALEGHTNWWLRIAHGWRCASRSHPGTTQRAILLVITFHTSTRSMARLFRQHLTVGSLLQTPTRRRP